GTMTASGSRFLNRTLNNSGVINVQSGSLGFASCSFNNLPGGVINLLGIATLSDVINPFSLNNSGTINGSSGFQGTLTLSGLNNSGTLNAIGSATIDASGAFLEGSKLTGAGSINIRGTLAGSVDSTVASLNIGSI